MSEEIIIDYEKMNTYKDVLARLSKQIQYDYTADTGSSMFKEDALAASIICLLTHAYTVKKD